MAQRAKPSVDVTPGNTAAQPARSAQRNQSIRQYVSDAIEARLQDSLPDKTSAGPTALKASADPVLSELWSNPADAAYADLQSCSSGSNGDSNRHVRTPKSRAGTRPVLRMFLTTVSPTDAGNRCRSLSARESG